MPKQVETRHKPDTILFAERNGKLYKCKVVSHDYFGVVVRFFDCVDSPFATSIDYDFQPEDLIKAN